MIDVSESTTFSLPVTDMEKPSHFDGEVLDCERNPNATGEHWVEYVTGNVTLAVMAPPTHDYEFTPLPPERCLARARRARGEGGTGGGRRAGGEMSDLGDVSSAAGVRDPDGNPILLHHRYKPYEPP